MSGSAWLWLLVLVSISNSLSLLNKIVYDIDNLSLHVIVWATLGQGRFPHVEGEQGKVGREQQGRQRTVPVQFC